VAQCIKVDIENGSAFLYEREVNHDGSVNDSVRFDRADYSPFWRAHLGDLAAEQGLEICHALTILTGSK
jgi:hypothetical protein